MKLRYVYIFLAILGSAYIFMGNSAGRADSRSWGNTGAPGDETLANGDSRTCITCHSSNNISVDLDISILNQDGSALVNNEYTPGQTYNMSVTIVPTAGQAPVRHGFQMLALTDADEQEVNTWANPSANVEIAFASNTGRTYVEQANASASNIFSMDWTAPESGNGDITFYSCGNGVNGNGSSTGDGATCTTMTLGEAITNSTFSFKEAPLDMEINPNPATDIINVEIVSPTQEEFTMNILSYNGQLMLSQAWSLSAASNKTSIEVADLPVGMYFLQMTNEKYSRTIKWVKQ